MFLSHSINPKTTGLTLTIAHGYLGIQITATRLRIAMAIIDTTKRRTAIRRTVTIVTERCPCGVGIAVLRARAAYSIGGAAEFDIVGEGVGYLAGEASAWSS